MTCDLPCPLKGVVAVAVADAVARHGGIPALILRTVSKEYAKGEKRKGETEKEKDDQIIGMRRALRGCFKWETPYSVHTVKEKVK